MGRSRSTPADGSEPSGGPTQTFVGGASRPPPLSALIRVTGMPAKPASFRLSTGVCNVGTGPHNDIVIDDPAVSRSHLELSLVPEGVLVCDRASRNGTFYLGQRVERIALSLGSRITV